VRTIDTLTGMETLDSQECLSLLGSKTIGRVAVVDGYSPVVFPVNYVLDGSGIVFRVAEGTKLHSVGRANACFEVDEFDEESRAGWSVLAVGRLEELTSLDPDFERVSRMPVHPWAEGHRPHLLRLVPSRVTGRRVGGGR